MQKWLKLIAGIALSVGMGSPGVAAIAVLGPAATATSCSAISFTGISEQACAGGYDKNLLKGTVQDPGLAALKALGYTGDGSFKEKLESLSGNTIDFSTVLTGITFIGIHYGGAGDDGSTATSFFRFDASTGVDKFTFNREGLSNAVLFQTGAVPEPATWAMMLLGFGGMGVAMRRARRRSTKAVFA